MAPTLETAVVALAVAQFAVPLLNGILSRRQTKTEEATDAVPLLMQKVDQIRVDLGEIKAELDLLRKHEAILGRHDLRLETLEKWQAVAGPQVHDLARDVDVVMRERAAQQLQRAAAAVTQSQEDRR